MEPRPQRPSRATGPFISTGTPSPTSGSTGGFGTGAYDASSAPPAPPPAIGYDPDYSPGQPLTPLRGPRGANIVGPLLAVAALAIIIAAVAFIVSQFRGDGGGDNPPATLVAAVDGTPGGDDEDGNGGAGADDQATEKPSDAENPTEDTGGDENADPTNTPRVNRPTESDDLAPGTGDATEAPDDSAGSGDEKTRARQWLPPASDIGEGYEQSDNGSRDAELVAGSFPDSEEAAAKLEEFGWVENSYRQYDLTGGAETDTLFINVSVHKFDSEQGAKDALDYFAAGGQTAQGLEEIDGEKIGEGTVYLQGPIEGGNVFVIYIRQNEFVFRIGGLSPTGDPAATTTEIAKRIVEP